MSDTPYGLKVSMMREFASLAQTVAKRLTQELCQTKVSTTRIYRLKVLLAKLVLLIDSIDRIDSAEIERHGGSGSGQTFYSSLITYIRTCVSDEQLPTKLSFNKEGNPILIEDRDSAYYPPSS